MFEREMYYLQKKKIKHGIYEMLIVQFKYGVNLKEAVGELLKRAKRRRRAVEIMILSDVKNNIVSGKSFANSIKSWIPQLDYTIIVSAEKGGKIESALELIVSLDNMKSELISEFLGGLVNPLILFFAVYGFLYYIGNYALTPILKMMPKGHVSGAAAVLVLLSKFVKSPWMFLTPVLLIFFTILIFFSFSRLTGGIRKILDKRFPYSLYRKFVGAVWLNGFSSLMAAGMNEINALKDMSKNSNDYLKERLTTFYKGLQNGMNLGDAMLILKYNFPDADTVEDIGMFSKFPDFDKKLKLIAEQNIKDLKKYIKTLSTVLGLAANLFLYALIIFIAVGVFSLMNNITSNLHY